MSGRTGDRDTGRVTLACAGCGAAMRVPMSVIHAGRSMRCDACGITVDLEPVARRQRSRLPARP